MNQYRKFLVLLSLSVVVTQSAPLAKYSAIEPDGPDADARPVKVAAPADVPVSLVNRKPAVEPRVYVESADSKTGYVYYDMPGQTRHSDSKLPE